MQREVYEFISKQTWDPIVERRICRRTGEDFPIFKWDVDLFDKLSPIIGGKKFDLPFPTLSPLARMRRRMMFRNERGLYKVPSAMSEKQIISVYHPSLGYTSVNAFEHASDAYDAKEYGKAYDETKSFMEQYAILLKSVPKVWSITINNENGEYNTFSSDSKNVYLCADVMWCENTFYSTTCKYVTNGVDLLNVWKSEWVAHCVSSHNLTKCSYVRYWEGCYDCSFLYTCKNCNNCFLCTNLIGQQNYIFNKPATPEQIEQIKALLKTTSWVEQLYKKFQELLETSVRPADWMINCENSFGSTLFDCKDTFFSFDSHDLENCRYCHVGEFNQDCMDCTIFNPQSSLNYEHVCGWWWTTKCITWTVCRDTKNAYFSEFPAHSNYLLWCVNLKRDNYCILNKEYKKEERERLASHIIEELQETWQWWEFFPTEICPFPYNDSVAMDYFPVHKVIFVDGREEIIDPDAHGTVILHSDEFISPAVLDLWWEEKIAIKWRTKDYEINIPENVPVIQADELTESIDEVEDTILKQVIICEKTGRPYTIVSQELKIYKKLWLALPTTHYSVRHTRRMRSRPAKEYHLRTCDKTWEQMLSLYPQNTPFPVYNIEPYKQEIYW